MQRRERSAPEAPFDEAGDDRGLGQQPLVRRVVRVATHLANEPPNWPLTAAARPPPFAQ